MSMPAPPSRARSYDNYTSNLGDVQEYIDAYNPDIQQQQQQYEQQQRQPQHQTSTRDFTEPLDLPDLDIGDQPQPPPYSVSELPTTEEAYDTTPNPNRSSGRSSNVTTPYAGVDRSSQLAYDYSDSPGNNSPQVNRFSGSSGGDFTSDFANMRLSAGTSPTTPQHPDQRMPEPGGYPSPYAANSLPPRQRSVTGGYPTNGGGGGGGRADPAASVYSLDSGVGAYNQQPPQRQRYPGGMGGPPPAGARVGGWPNQPYPPGGGPQQFAPNQQYPQGGPGVPPGHRPPPGPGGFINNNPYYSAANDFVGMPPGAPRPGPAAPSAYPGGPGGGPPSVQGPSRQASMSNLARTNTSRSTLSLASVSSIPRMPIESVGASSTRRRGGAAAIDVSKPPYTREFVDDYRNRMKVDPDPEAQFAFAKYLIEAAKKIGEEISKNDPRQGRRYRDSLLAESLRTIKKLAEGSKEPYADAQFLLANLYGTGQLGLQVDHEKAYYLYLMASKLNHPAATYRAAVCCELGAGTKRDGDRSVLFYRKAATLGDTAAMYKLALILLNGLMGHKRNPREALVWLRRAAAQADEDNPHALHELALLHERPNNNSGGVIPHDPHLAREYFTQAAQQFHYAPSMMKLGNCHEFGTLGFPIDPRRSIAWYTRAAERGDAEAELALSGWYLTGSEGVLKQSDTEAYLWGRKAANKGLAKAEYAVGYYTEIGIGVKQDLELAKRWYIRAATQGNMRAKQRLAELNSNRNPKGKSARPTRKDAESECVIM